MGLSSLAAQTGIGDLGRQWISAARPVCAGLTTVAGPTANVAATADGDEASGAIRAVTASSFDAYRTTNLHHGAAMMAAYHAVRRANGVIGLRRAKFASYLVMSLTAS